jgi:RNA polymerase sigma-70 factor (ECF subfamily)
LDDDAGVRALYAAHGRELHGFALRCLGDAGLAQEAVQEVFVRAWRAADRYDPSRASMRTWLFAIARTTVIDLARARGARPQLAPAPAAVADEPGEPAEVDRLADAWVVDAALRSLGEDHRAAILAVHHRGLGYEEAGRELGVPAGTVKSRVFYGLRAMRTALEELGWSEVPGG